MLVKQEVRRTKLVSGRRVMVMNDTEKRRAQPGVRREFKKKSGRSNKDYATTAQVSRAHYASRICHFFENFKKVRTCSVFGMKACTTQHLKIAVAVTKQLFGRQVFCLGAVESAPSGPHGHIMVFRAHWSGGREGSGDLTPQPLTLAEERALCSLVSAHSLVWDAESDEVKGQPVCRWMARLSNLKDRRLEKAKSKIPDDVADLEVKAIPALSDEFSESVLYRVPKVVINDKQVASGRGDAAATYCLKSMWSNTQAHLFLGSAGLTPVVNLVKKTTDVKVKQRQVWQAYHSTYHFDVLSLVVYEICRMIHLGHDPKEISVYTKYKRVTSVPGGNLLIKDNRYLLVGLELLRRDLQQFTGSSSLKRMTNQVCKLYCGGIRNIEDERLVAWAQREKARIDNNGRVNRLNNIHRSVN